MGLSYTKYIFNKKNVLPIHLILEATSACNSKCLTCFNWKKTDSKKERRISLENLEKISESLGHLLWFSISGGEPFLRNDLPEIVRIFEKNNKVAYLTIPTNCILPIKIQKTMEKILKIHKGNTVITLSLDGIGELHDKIRGVKGNFEKFLETYEKLKKLQKIFKNLHIGINTVINTLNQDKVEEIHKYVKDNLDVESHSFEILRGCSRSQEAKAPSIGFYKKHKDFLIKIIKEKTYYTFNPMSVMLRAAKRYYHDLALDTMIKKRQLNECYAGRLSAVIDCRGNVYPCELYKKMGDLKETNYNFRQLWFSEKAEKIRKEIIDKKCYCTHSCFQFINILFNPKIYPQLTKYLI